MHVVQIYKDYPPVTGGIEHHLALLSEGLAARGHHVTVLVSAPGLHPRSYEERGVRIIAVGRLATVASTPLSPALPGQLAHLRPDLIHLHHPYPPGDLAILLAGRRSPFVVTYHSDIIRQRRLKLVVAPLVRHTLRTAASIVVGSPAYMHSSPWLAPITEHCRVVPYGLPLERFGQADQRLVAALQARYPGPLVLFVGRLRYYKGAEVLVRAMAEVPGQAIFVGADATVRRADLIDLARQIGVAERVHFVGAQDDEHLRAFYHAATVFVLPSLERSESFGLVQVEAQAAGLPIVCTELGTGTSYVTRHGETGIVVPPGDEQALARALRLLLANPALAQAYGNAGRLRAAREFSLGTMLDRIETIYAEAIRR